MLYAIKPLLIGSVQALCYENPTLQLSLLGAISTVCLSLMWIYQARYDLFINKKLFCIDWLLSATMALLNLTLYLKFVYLEE